MDNSCKIEKQEMRNKRYCEIWKTAEKHIDEIIADDQKWGLYKRRIRTVLGTDLDGNLFPFDPREAANKSEDFRRYLQWMYFYTSSFICDNCEYNSRPRKGSRKYTRPKRFYCSYTKGSAEWEMKKHLERNPGNRARPPPWLRVEDNFCPHYSHATTSHTKTRETLSFSS